MSFMSIKWFVPVTVRVIFKGCSVWCSVNKLQFLIHWYWHVMRSFLMLHSQTCISDIHGSFQVKLPLNVLSYVSWYSRSLQQKNVGCMGINSFIPMIFIFRNWSGWNSVYKVPHDAIEQFEFHENLHNGSHTSHQEIN